MWEIILRKRTELELQAELAERRQAEEQVRRLNASLEQRVIERTEDLRQVNTELERALQVKDEFLASMSHELRTPLTGILGLSEVLLMDIYGQLNEKQRSSVHNIETSGRHLLALINDILDLAKIEADRLELEMGSCVVEDVCQASLQLVKGMAHKKGLKLNYVIQPENIRLQADERRLKQMLVNLLSNAVKFTPEGGSIGLDVQPFSGPRVIQFTVWDTGIGIAPEQIGRLFKPFVQLDSGLDRQHTGTGLGLSLVSRMAEAHGGRVGVESVPGAGSRFSITLPWQATQPAADPADPADPARLAAPAALEPLRPGADERQHTILVLDDSDMSLMVVREYLEYLGYHVETACDGREAIAELHRVMPDLILADVQMPGIDGLQLTRIIRGYASFKNTPIIALTALTMPGDRERCLAAGMDDYISKPVDMHSLAAMIKAHLRPAERNPATRLGL